MAEDCLQRLEEAMDRIWFHQNVLLPSSVQLSLETVRKDRGPRPAAAPAGSSDEKGRHHGYRKKRPTRLNLVTSDHLFQMPPSPLTRWGCHPSSLPPSTENSPQSRNNSSSRRPTKTMRSYKSLSELEQDELKGFMDLGFVFHKESLSPRMMSVIPGLQRLGKKADSHRQLKGGEATTTEGVRRPYLAEAWFINSPSSPLMNLRMLPASSAPGTDIKRRIRFWARTVASTIHQES